MKKSFLVVLFFTIVQAGLLAVNPPIYIAFQWHMHQPIYQPGETVIETQNSGVLSYNLYDVFTSRTGPYTTWPSNAVNKMLSFDHAGAQVSFSGSLVENLNVLEANGIGFSNWKSAWQSMIPKKTSLGNQRMDMVGFGYHHPIMPLIDREDIEKQIQKHKEAFAANFPGLPYSKGIFPPENAFEEHIIPALKNSGLDWVMVDNIHFDRTCNSYPWGNGGSIVEVNKADIVNPNPNDWQKLNGLWAPLPVSAAWGHRPHWMKYVDPATGTEYKMIVVPTSTFFGNEDGRGGFGALNYEATMSQIESYNTDSEHPILIVLHHDGDNHGGGSESYYGSNFDNFVSWLQANPDRFVCTTIQDYLQQFPPAADDIIHVESGSWYGAGADPEFLKWNGDPVNGYSPDRNSWSVITAASNIVKTAEQINPSSPDTKAAWDYLLVGETSCYWYWDGTEDWDNKPTRAANLATTAAMKVVNTSSDLTPPSIYHPQRDPYNPGETEWGVVQSSDFTVWSYVYDVSGLSSVKLKYRLDKDGKNPLSSNQNETYIGGEEVNEWQELDMLKKTIASKGLAPLYKADEYSAQINGIRNKLVDYYIEATDSKGNVARSMILHTWVGTGDGSSSTTLSVSPAGGYYEGGTTVTLTATGENEPVYIYYTLDGTTPTVNSSKVPSGGTVSITQDKTTLKAIAIDSQGIESTMFTYVYYTVKPDGITIKFQKPSEWSKVYLYAWTSTTPDLLGAWPGTEIQADADGWYSYTFTDDITDVNLVFSNGSGSQTQDVTQVTAGTCFKTNGISGGKYVVVTTDCQEGGITPPPPSGSGITVKFQKPEEWNKVYFYAWTGTSTNLLGAWPGTEIKANAQNWYAYTFAEGINSINMVFSNGSGSQSVDVTGISSDICYKTNGTANGKYLVVSTDCSSTGVNNHEKYSLIISPNPVKNRLSVLSEKPFTKVELISVSGSVMKIFENEQTLEMSNIPAGLYFIKVHFLDHSFVVEKIIKL